MLSCELLYYSKHISEPSLLSPRGVLFICYIYIASWLGGCLPLTLYCNFNPHSCARGHPTFSVVWRTRSPSFLTTLKSTASEEHLDLSGLSLVEELVAFLRGVMLFAWQCIFWHILIQPHTTVDTRKQLIHQE